MSISLLGIIFVQGLWISHAVKIEQAAFDKSVYDALKRGIDNVRSNEMFMFMNERIDLPAPHDVYIDHGFTDSIVKWESRKQINSNNNTTITSTVTTIDRDGKSTIVLYNDTFSDSPSRVKRPLKVVVNKELIEVEELEDHLEDIHLDELSELDIDFDASEYSVLLNDELVELEYQMDSIQRIIVLEAEKERIVTEKLSEFQDNIDQWVFEFKFDDERLEFLAHEGNIDEIIRKSLTNNGIYLDFNYQLISEETDTSVVISSSPDTSIILNHKYTTELFPNDVFRSSTFLTVDFPEANVLIYRSVALLITGSLLFTVIILITFGFTLYYIQKQKKISEIKSDFINNMTHEFKTPIATISLASSAMESPKVVGDNDKTSYYIDIIKKENKRMNSQVERVLQMAQIDNQDFNLSLIKTDVHEIIDNVAAVFAMRADEKGGHILTSLKANCYEISVDEIHFANVLNNLIDNAIKYNDNAPEILLETSVRNGKFVLEVSDNGQGMSKEVQKHAFEKFYRKPSGNIHNIKGFGLGLSYVKAIVEAHGGEISIDSEVNNGSKFIISLECKL